MGDFFMENVKNDSIKSEIKLHTANIFNREKLEIIGVNQVISSTPTEVLINVCDYMMQVFGSNLTVTKLDPEQKFLSITGKIDGIKYDKKLTKKSFFGKVFK